MVVCIPLRIGHELFLTRGDIAQTLIQGLGPLIFGIAVALALIPLRKHRSRRGNKYDRVHVEGARSADQAPRVDALRFDMPSPARVDDPLQGSLTAMKSFDQPFVLLTSDQLVVEQGPTRRAAIPLKYITSIVAASGVGFVLRNVGKQVVYYTTVGGYSPDVGAAVSITIGFSEPTEVLRGRRRLTRHVVLQLKDPQSFVHAVESVTDADADTERLEPILAKATARKARQKPWIQVVARGFSKLTKRLRGKRS